MGLSKALEAHLPGILLGLLYVLMSRGSRAGPSGIWGECVTISSDIRGSGSPQLQALPTFTVEPYVALNPLYHHQVIPLSCLSYLLGEPMAMLACEHVQDNLGALQSVALSLLPLLVTLSDSRHQARVIFPRTMSPSPQWKFPAL